MIIVPNREIIAPRRKSRIIQAAPPPPPPPHGLGAGIPTPINTFPASISSCVTWFRSDLGLEVDGSGNVSSWRDQVGAANSQTLSQANSALRPPYLANAINGYPGADFHAAGYSLASGTTLNVNNGYEIFAVVHYTTVVASGGLIDLTGSGYPAIEMNGAGTSIGQKPSGAIDNLVALTTSHNYLIDCYFNTSGSFCYASTTTNSTTASLGAVVPSEGSLIIVGNTALGQNFGGAVVELAIYNANVGATARAAWKTYATNRYGFTA